MKKILKITGITLLVILVILIVTPIVFRKPIMQKVQDEINKSVNATVNFDLRLSLIKGFPNLFVELKNLSVIGINEFEGDTLLAFRSFSAKVDLISAIKMENIDVKAIILDHPKIYGLVLPDGKANWDIVKDTATTPEEVDTTVSEPTKFSVKLRKFEIISADIKYEDQSAHMAADIRNFNFLLKGNLADDFTTIHITTSAQALSFLMDGISYLNKASLNGRFDVDADMKNMKFLLKDNEFALNDLALGWTGSIAMPNDSILLDLKYGTRKTDFKSLLSMVPAIYAKDFAGLEAAGALKLDGTLSGIVYDTILPNANITLLVENAMFKYPDLPASVNNINIDLAAAFDGQVMDNSKVELRKFHLEMAGNPVDFLLKVQTPMSDPQVEGAFIGKIDLGSVSKIMPLDSTDLAGLIESDIRFAGRLSMLEKEQYEDFKADGKLQMIGIQYKSPDLPQGMTISRSELEFTPRFLDLKSFDMKVGKSDLQLSGKIMDFIPYAFSDKTLKADFRFSSSLLDANEFLSGESEEVAEEPVDTSAMEVIEIPRNIDFKLTSSLGKVLYDKLEITNINGIIRVSDGIARMEDLNMNLLQGSMLMNGEYNTADITKPFVDFKLKITDFDIPSAFASFSMVEKFAPAAQNAKGKISSSLTINTLLDSAMSPVMSSVSGAGSLSSKQVELGNSKVFNKLADALKNEKLRQVVVKDVNLNFEIKDGRVYVEPFDAKLGSTTLTVGGDQGLDQSLNYTMAMNVPRSDLGASALSNLQSAAAAKGLQINPGDQLKIKVKVGGTFSNPDVRPDLSESGENVMQSVKEQVKEKATQAIEEKKQEVKARVNEEAQKILENAEKEAQKIRDAAKQAAELERKKANELADKTINEAKGKPKFAQDLAKKTADKIRKEGDEKANKIVKEGDAKAEAVLAKAREEAEKLK